jgi:Na+-driven multidrug efflux pump
MDASTYVLIFITPINVALNVYFVHYTDFGIYGSPIALSFTFSFAFFFLIIYTAYSPAHKQNGTWGGLQLRAVLDARSCIALLKLALPGILMVGTEWCVTPCPSLLFTPVTSVCQSTQCSVSQGRLRNCSTSSRSSGHCPARRTISHHDYRSKCAFFPTPPLS